MRHPRVQRAAPIFADRVYRVAPDNFARDALGNFRAVDAGGYTVVRGDRARGDGVTGSDRDRVQGEFPADSPGLFSLDDGHLPGYRPVVDAAAAHLWVRYTGGQAYALPGYTPSPKELDAGRDTIATLKTSLRYREGTAVVVKSDTAGVEYAERAGRILDVDGFAVIIIAEPGRHGAGKWWTPYEITSGGRMGAQQSTFDAARAFVYRVTRGTGAQFVRDAIAAHSAKYPKPAPQESPS